MADDNHAFVSPWMFYMSIACMTRNMLLLTVENKMQRKENSLINKYRSMFWYHR